MAADDTRRIADALVTELDCQATELRSDLQRLDSLVADLRRYIPDREYLLTTTRLVGRRMESRHKRISQVTKELAAALELDSADKTNPRMVRPSGEYAILPEDIE